jgi:hypothetical protein
VRSWLERKTSGYLEIISGAILCFTALIGVLSSTCYKSVCAARFYSAILSTSCVVLIGLNIATIMLLPDVLAPSCSYYNRDDEEEANNCEIRNILMWAVPTVNLFVLLVASVSHHPSSDVHSTSIRLVVSYAAYPTKNH